MDARTRIPMDSTTLDLIERLDVYDTGLNDFTDYPTPDPQALAALRRAAADLIETIDIIDPPAKEKT